MELRYWRLDIRSFRWTERGYGEVIFETRWSKDSMTCEQVEGMKRWKLDILSWVGIIGFPLGALHQRRWIEKRQR